MLGGYSLFVITSCFDFSKNLIFETEIIFTFIFKNLIPCLVIHKVFFHAQLVFNSFISWLYLASF